MKYVPCFNCQSTENAPYAEENGFTLVKCAGCGLIYLNPRPEEAEIAQAAREGLHSGVEELDVTGMFSFNRVFNYRQVLADLFPNPSALAGKAWLDVGCGHGEFLYALRQYCGNNITLKGIEPNIHKQSSAQKHGLDVSWFELDAHPKSYDIISLLNVFSHLSDPLTALQSYRAALKQNGELILETGDTADFPSKDHYRPFLIPDHLSFANERIMVGLLEKSGFEILAIHKYPFIRWNWVSFMYETVKVFWPGKHSRLKYMFQRRKYAHADMYIHAKAKR